MDRRFPGQGEGFSTEGGNDMRTMTASFGSAIGPRDYAAIRNGSYKSS